MLNIFVLISHLALEFAAYLCQFPVANLNGVNGIDLWPRDIDILINKINPNQFRRKSLCLNIPEFCMMPIRPYRIHTTFFIVFFLSLAISKTHQQQQKTKLHIYKRSNTYSLDKLSYDTIQYDVLSLLKQYIQWKMLVTSAPLFSLSFCRITRFWFFLTIEWLLFGWITMPAAIVTVCVLRA